MKLYTYSTAVDMFSQCEFQDPQIQALTPYIYIHRTHVQKLYGDSDIASISMALYDAVDPFQVPEMASDNVISHQYSVISPCPLIVHPPSQALAVQGQLRWGDKNGNSLGFFAALAHLSVVCRHIVSAPTYVVQLHSCIYIYIHIYMCVCDIYT